MQGEIMTPRKAASRLSRIVPVLLAVFLFTAPGSAYSQTKVAWIDYNSGLALSKKSKKTVFIFFYADWCGYCGMMDRSNFTDTGIAGVLNGNFISIRLNVDSETKINAFNKHPMLPRELFSAMNGSALPYMVFTDSDGNMITGIPGYVNKDVLYPLLTYIQAGCFNKNVTFEEYLGGSRSCSK